MRFFKCKLLFKRSSTDVLIHEIRKLRREIMATKAEVLQAIADEKAQVLTAIEEFNKQVQELKDQIASGDPVTATDLDDIVTAVHDIFIPTVE